MPNQVNNSIKKRKQLGEHVAKIEREIRKIVTLPENIVPFLVPGRLLRICIGGNETTKDQDWGWGILVSFTKQKINPKNLKDLGKNKELQ